MAQDGVPPGAGSLALSERALAMMASAIREVANSGIERDDIIALWFGEGCWPTPKPIVEAASAAMAAGDHFYAPNAGKSDLRSAISHYYARIYGLNIVRERIIVTGSGMLALALAGQSLVTPGDKAVVVEPVWPNIPETLKFAGARIERVGLEADEAGRWRLDTVRLLDALTPDTRLVVINSPNNPSGWTADTETLRAISAHCRRFGIWIIADDVYSRIYYEADHAPGLIEFMGPEDRMLSVNSFSKAWNMTGWRIGWMILPQGYRDTYEQMTEYFNSCVANFSQVGGIAALEHGEPHVQALKTKLAAARELVTERLTAMPRVRFSRPDGAFYAFFAVDGLTDSTQAAKDLLANAGIGIAPGCAFGRSGEGFLRLCYAKEAGTMHAALDRIESYLA